VGAASNRDPRKVAVVQALHIRAADQTTEALKPFDQPLISVTFDDGWESVYTEALPVMQENGIATTQYIITDVFDNYQYMSLAQLHSMQDAGHEIGSHTVSHADLTTLDETKLGHELLDSKKLLQNEFKAPVNDFTSPYGSYNKHTLETIGNYYRSQKNAEGDPDANELEAINIRNSFDPLNIKSYSVRQNTTLDDIQKLIKAAKENNGWLVLTYHQIDTSNETFSVSPEHFKQQMQLISGSDVRTPTLGKVLDSLLPNKDVEY
jgi:peptidoglycan/xylan/chitin deacetylase (PgdA/CDA1 family)